MVEEQIAPELPDFPIFDANDAEATFGCKRDRYISRDDSYAVSRKLPALAKVANSLFFNGGKLADFDIEWRPEIDRAQAMRCLRGMLCSFAAAHEQKEATIALALHHWTRATGPRP